MKNRHDYRTMINENLKTDTMIHNIDNKFDLLLVWLMSSLSFMSMNHYVGLFAILASITSILRSLPSIIRNFKTKKNEQS